LQAEYVGFCSVELSQQNREPAVHAIDVEGSYFHEHSLFRYEVGFEIGSMEEPKMTFPTRADPGVPDGAALEAATMRKVGLRLIPFLVLCYFIAYVDRMNVGFAALTMNKDLGLSSAAFGVGGGLFFAAYVLFEVPSNLAMEKVGARLWIARIDHLGSGGNRVRVRCRCGIFFGRAVSDGCG
jgi:hypothetical protein